MEDKNIVVWFSCGAASAVASKLILDRYGDRNNIQIVNNPIKEEDTDNRRFKEDVENWLDHPIIEAKNKYFPNASIIEVFDKEKYMSGIRGGVLYQTTKKGSEVSV